VTYEEITAEKIIKEWSANWAENDNMRRDPEVSSCELRKIIAKYLGEAIDEGKKRAKK
jgi:hypothetical protein